MTKEYIEREALIENLNKFAPEHYSSLINMLITKQPTADVVEVVRCRDCKHHRNSGYGLMCYHPDGLNSFISGNYFCSYGERKVK